MTRLPRLITTRHLFWDEIQNAVFTRRNVRYLGSLDSDYSGCSLERQREWLEIRAEVLCSEHAEMWGKS